MARFIGNYEILRELGAGHYGAVYLAVGDVPGRGMQPGRRRLVAIKKLKDAADADSVDLLVQEFALLEQVKHRGIVRVFEYLEDEHAVVMEYIHGVTLRSMFDELDKAHEQVFTEAALEMGCELADALYQAWTTPGDNGEPLQLVHRDLKPDNVMLTPSGEIKILDWGLARVDNADFRADDADRVKGSLMYMAPEQAQGLEVDHRTDLFAVGLILYELLLNEPVYGVNDRAADPWKDVLRRIRSGDTAQPCADIEKTLPKVGSVVTRALQNRPEDRYQHGHDLMVDLRRALYRDRGAYLQEFCEFFFGTICDIGDAPTLDTVDARRRGGRSRARASIEERLRQSMAREKQAASVKQARDPGDSAPAPRVSAGRAPRPAPGRAPVASLGSAASSARPTSSGGRMAGSSGSSGRGGRKPPAPPVGGGASRATPFVPPARGGGAPKPPRQVGRRAPDETGMLQMVPLTDDDEAEAAADPSATAFFAIPAPKAERSTGGGGRPVPAAPPVGVAPPPPPPGVAAPPAPPPVAVPGIRAGGPAGSTGVAGTPPPPRPVIQGPVASYGGQPQASPFQVTGGAPMSAPSADSSQRVQSNRVFAFLFALALLVCTAVVLAVWLMPAMLGKDGDADAVAVAPVMPPPTHAKAPATDTAEPPPAPKSNPRHSSSHTSSGSSGKPKPQAAPSGPAMLTVTLTDPSAASAVTVQCPVAGTRHRATFQGGVAHVANVPQDKCVMRFQGSLSPAKYEPVHGGQSLTCTIDGTQGKCR